VNGRLIKFRTKVKLTSVTASWLTDKSKIRDV
jgi:hypothetical protein